MKYQQYAATGSAVETLPEELLSRFRIEYHHDGNGVDVLLSEKMEFVRTASNMQVTIIVERVDPEKCFVDIIVGGGAAGVLPLTWGAEKKILKSMRSDVEEIAEDLGLEMTRQESKLNYQPP